MNRLSNQHIVINLTDDDITDFIKDLTILPPKGKGNFVFYFWNKMIWLKIKIENSEPLQSTTTTPSVLKRRKSIKPKQTETSNKATSEAVIENEKTDQEILLVWFFNNKNIF